MRLFLIPTSLEWQQIRQHMPDWAAWVRQVGDVALCGFGPIAAAARASQLLTHYHPETVTLLGIAGLYEERLPHFAVGDAAVMDEVICHGVGVGEGEDYRSSDEMGWKQWAGDAQGSLVTADYEPGGEPMQAFSSLPARMSQSIQDRIPLRPVVNRKPHCLLTCCSSSASPEQAAARLQFCENAIAEDMEGFGVALACQLHQTPLTIVRGFSNLVSDRRHANWQIRDAMLSAAALAQELATAPADHHSE